MASYRELRALQRLAEEQKPKAPYGRLAKETDFYITKSPCCWHVIEAGTGRGLVKHLRQEDAEASIRRFVRERNQPVIDAAIDELKRGLLFAVAYEAGVFEGHALLDLGVTREQRSAWQATMCEVSC